MTAASQPVPDLPEELWTLLAAQHGAARWDEVRGCGIGQQRATALVRKGALVRVSRGAYVEGARWARADKRERHALRATAIARTWADGTAVSHASAALLHGLPLLVFPPVVQGSRTDGGQNRRRRTYSVYRAYPGVEPVLLRGVPAVPAAHAALGVVDRHGLEAGVVVMDAAVHGGLVTFEGLSELLARCRFHPVHARAAAALRLVDGATESPGETRTRLVLRRLGFAVRSQVDVVGPEGVWLGRADFVMEGERVVIEFDGMVKYREHGRLAVEDKGRDLAMQRAGYEVVRLVWSDLSEPEKVRQMVEEAVRRARGSRPGRRVA
ncbi:type IV toxin-antitoxin system AbiEi family antitoxin domain-containing protein [Kytococcus sp. Marseille-QA3725]